MNFLQHVMEYKIVEVQALKQSLAAHAFSALFATRRQQPVFIAEIKPKSPASGVLYSGNLVKLAQTYEHAGVDAISVLTDTPSFGGSIGLLKDIKTAVKLPILRKDFIIDTVQLVESATAGADAVLLIVALLKKNKLIEIIRCSYTLGLTPVVEIFDEKELEVALAAGAQIIGVNARNLQTLEVSAAHALKVLAKIPNGIHSLLFSGITTRADVGAATRAGASGVLVGTSILTAKNIEQKIQELRYENR